MSTGSQQLFGSNTSPDIDTALEARIKDALWFLARQWQLGEFEAENGGLPMQVHVKAKIYPLTECRMGGETRDFTPDVPLEYVVEAERESGVEGEPVQPPGWQAASLAYNFTLTTDVHTLDAEGYDGRAMDWHDFVLSERAQGSEGAIDEWSMIPGQLQIRGVPEPRFWEIEDRHAYFDSGESAEPNILSVLLPEFFYTDIKNWYMIPAPMPAGAVREVETVTVIDSFGVATELEPVGRRVEDDLFSVFAIDTKGDAPTDSSTLLCLNTAAKVGSNDLIEEVRFLRDEAANLVWGWERQLTDSESGLYSTALEPRREAVEAAVPLETDLRFRLKSETARAFIPYVPRKTLDVTAVDGAIALRRARSNEEYSSSNPQYRGKIIGESRYLNEEDIPRSGLRLRRINRFARGSDDEVYFWVGRDKDVARPTRKPKLSFDDLLKVETKDT